jgi:hypothetical protein
VTASVARSINHAKKDWGNEQYPCDAAINRSSTNGRSTGVEARLGFSRLRRMEESGKRKKTFDKTRGINVEGPQAQMSSDIATSGFRFFVAIDFGTHGSGFAYMSKNESTPRTYE